MDYYNRNADDFIERSVNVDVSKLYESFEYHFEGEKILEIGFGSGRDSLHFSKRFEVVSIDSSIEFCKRAEKTLTNEVRHLDVKDLDYENEFDGIWACASLLHLKSTELGSVLNKCYTALKAKGICYVSFKYGTFEGDRNGRHFLDMTENEFQKYLKETKFKGAKYFITTDHREGKPDWLNIILFK